MQCLRLDQAMASGSAVTVYRDHRDSEELHRLLVGPQDEQDNVDLGTIRTISSFETSSSHNSKVCIPRKTDVCHRCIDVDRRAISEI